MALQVTIEHQTGSKAGQTEAFPVDGPLTVGRDPSCTLAFDPVEDADVSGLHARIVPAQGGGLAIVDESRNGTFVNGMRAPQGEPFPLENGAVIEFGPPGSGPRVQLSVSAPPAQAPPPDAEAEDAPAEGEDEPVEVGPEEEEEGGGKGFLACCLVVVVVALLGGGLATWYWAFHLPAERTATENARDEAVATRDAATEDLPEGVDPADSPAFAEASEALAEGEAFLEEGSLEEARPLLDSAEEGFSEAEEELADLTLAHRRSAEAAEAAERYETTLRATEAVGAGAIQEHAGRAWTQGLNRREEAIRLETEAEEAVDEGAFAEAARLWSNAASAYETGILRLDQARSDTDLALRSTGTPPPPAPPPPLGSTGDGEEDGDAGNGDADATEDGDPSGENGDGGGGEETTAAEASEMTPEEQEASLAEVARARRGAICLVRSRTFVVPSGGSESQRRPIETMDGIGTGFLVTGDRVITAKRVIYPWKFDEEMLGRIEWLEDQGRFRILTYVQVHFAGPEGDWGPLESTSSFDTDGNLQIKAQLDDATIEARTVTILANGRDTPVEGVRPHHPVAGNAVALKVTSPQGLGIEPFELAAPAPFVGGRVLAVEVQAEPEGAAEGDGTLIEGLGNLTEADARSLAVQAPGTPTGVGAPIIAPDGTVCGLVVGIGEDQQSLTGLPAPGLRSLLPLEAR